MTSKDKKICTLIKRCPLLTGKETRKNFRFLTNRPEPRTPNRGPKEDIFGETRTYGNPKLPFLFHGTGK